MSMEMDKSYSLCIITDTFGHVHFCMKQVETRFKRGNKMVATDGITQIDEVSQTFTDFFWKNGSGEACHYNVVKFLTINIS